MTYSPMEHVLRTNGDKRPGVILHLGAGACSELPAYLASGAAHIRLLEPNPVAVKALERATQEHPDVSVDARAVGEENGSAPFKIFNLASFSSLRRPTGLGELFPGLRVVSEPEVFVVTIDSLLNELPFQDGTSNILVIDAPGEEGRIVEDLLEGQWLHRFDLICLHCGASELYEGSRAADDLRALLEAAGYRLESLNEDDPDRPCLALRLQPLVLEAAVLRKALSDLQNAREEDEARHAAEAAKLEQSLAEAIAARDEGARARKALEQSLAEAIAAREESVKTRKALKLKLDEAEAAKSQLEQAKGEVQTARQDLAVAIRLQGLAQSDLRDLQRRYAEVLRERDEHEELLRKLTPRLQKASTYLQELAVGQEKASSPKKLRNTGAGKPRRAPGKRSRS